MTPAGHSRIERVLETVMQTYLLLVAALTIAAGPVSAMRFRLPQTAPPAAAPAFEAASVKANKSGEMGAFVRRQPGGRFTATNMPLRQLIVFAYQIRPFQLEGGPGWLNDRFDIVAKAEGDPPAVMPGSGPDQMMLMMRTLLAERFKLVLHNETKDVPIYTLVLARSDGKLGPQLKVSTTDCVALAAAAGRDGQPPGPPAPPKPGEIPQCGLFGGPGTMAMGGLPLSQLANGLSGLVQRVVVDRTGLSGVYDLTITYTPDQSQRPPGALPPGLEPPALDPNGPSIFTAVQEQLGLRLESTRGPVEIVVIDRVEPPTPD
jgi:uncharacterized protein (TIGR03435 family)